jgi:hypothetical protein
MDSIDAQLEAIPDQSPQEDPLLTRLKEPATQFNTICNSNLNDWVLFQNHQGIDNRFTDKVQLQNLDNEIKLVNQKQSQVDNTPVDKVNIVDLFQKIVNTHPHIHHITFPIPSFIEDLARQVVTSKLKDQLQERTRLFERANSFKSLLSAVRTKSDELRDMDSDEHDQLMGQYEQNDVTLNLYAICERIVETGAAMELILLAAKGPHPITVKPALASEILQLGIYAKSKNSIFPVSLEDLSREIKILSDNFTQVSSQLKEIDAGIDRVRNGDYSMFGDDFNPYLFITKQTIFQSLPRLQEAREIYTTTTTIHTEPTLNIDGSVTQSSQKYEILVKSATLNGGYGFFFQAADTSENELLNLERSDNILDLKIVQCDVVPDGSSCHRVDLPPNSTKGAKAEKLQNNLQKLQPPTNISRYISSLHSPSDPNAVDNSDWYQSPLSEPRYSTPKKRELSQLEKYKQSMGQMLATSEGPQFSYGDNATLAIPVRAGFSISTDVGVIMNQSEDRRRESRGTEFLYSLCQSLKPNSTHYTARFFFFNSRALLQDLLSQFNTTPNTAQAANSSVPLYEGSQVPLAGLYNQGVTCYLNTYLQALYGLPFFRKALFYLPVTQTDTDTRPEEVYTPLCTHVDQITRHTNKNEDLVVLDPILLKNDIGSDEKWTEHSDDKRYCTSLREHFVRNGCIGKHIHVDGLQDLSGQDEIAIENTAKKIVKKLKIKKIPLKKIVHHRATPNTIALQSLFLTMQTASHNYFKHIYTNKYKNIFALSPTSVSHISPLKHQSCAQTTNDVTSSFLSPQFGWTRAQLYEQQDLQELARKVADNIETSTYNTIVEGFSQRIFKGYFENLTEAINVPFKKMSEEAFEELILPVKDCATLGDSLKTLQLPEEIEGFKTDNPQYGAQTVNRSQRLTDKLPPVLTLMLKRMDFDYETFEQTKINSMVRFPPVLDMSKYVHRSANGADIPESHRNIERVDIEEQVREYGIDFDQYNNAYNQFTTHLPQTEIDSKKCPLHGDQTLIYDLYSVLVHAGNINSGHYINFIRPLRATHDDSSAQLSHDNDSYVLPQNRYQIATLPAESDEVLNDTYYNIDGEYIEQDESTKLQKLEEDKCAANLNQGNKCSCNFNHKKADYYRQGDWYCFDDNDVSLTGPKNAIDDNYGTDARSFSGKSAYLLMYINRRYTYYDSSNQCNELVFHPATFSEIGKKLLPGSVLDFENDANVMGLVKDALGDEMDIPNQNELTINNGQIGPAHHADDEKETQTTEKRVFACIEDEIFDQISTERENFVETFRTSAIRKNLTELSQLQQAYKNHNTFVDVYAPLPLRRVYAQQKAANTKGSRYNPLPPPLEQHGEFPDHQNQNYPPQYDQPPNYPSDSAHSGDFSGHGGGYGGYGTDAPEGSRLNEESTMGGEDDPAPLTNVGMDHVQ